MTPRRWWNMAVIGAVAVFVIGVAREQTDLSADRDVCADVSDAAVRACTVVQEAEFGRAMEGLLALAFVAAVVLLVAHLIIRKREQSEG